MITVPNNLKIVAATSIGLLITGVAAAAVLIPDSSKKPQQFRDDGGDVLKATISPTDEAPKASVTVNGDPVPLKKSGTTHFNNDGTEGSVTVSGGEAGDQNSNSNSVNVSVESHSTEGKTRSKTRIRSSEGSTRTTSNTEIDIRGEGQVNP